MSDWIEHMRRYLEYEKNAENKHYIERLLKNNDLTQLKQLLSKRLTFGTAGLRGTMGPGFSQMNDLVIIQTSQGLADYIWETKGEKICKEQGVIIGHDARHNSDRFARLTALAFLQKGFPIYYCDLIIPTPLVAYGVKHFGCTAGIVITASHNPKDDNGYKVYWSNGAQILSPHDRNIQQHIERPENQRPWPRAWEHECLKTGTTVSMPKEWEEMFYRIHKNLSNSYFTYIEQLVGERRQRNQSSSIGITYTTMHGVGHTYLSRALDIAGFDDTFPVEMQKKPDPDFSTVKFPNPEESGALDLAFETAKHARSNLILANDPDADRCAAALYDPVTDYRRILTGNEIGALLGWWIWHNYKNRGINSVDEFDAAEEPAAAGSKSTPSTPPLKRSEDCYMLSTAVSSKFLQSMAAKEGFNFVETLTGFKYMGNVADELQRQGKLVLFAYEEAIGYMVDSSILDKDGISAAIQVAQCAAYVSSQLHRTLEDQLDWLYSTYGYHYNLNSYYICKDQAIITTIFHELQSNFPKSFESQVDTFKEKFLVTRVRDLNIGFDSGVPGHKPILPTSSSSYMVTFFIGDEITFTIRTSGTEPKIKYYSEIIAKLPPGASDSRLPVKMSAQERLNRFVQAAIERCLRPSHYNLQAAE